MKKLFRNSILSFIILALLSVPAFSKGRNEQSIEESPYYLMLGGIVNFENYDKSTVEGVRFGSSSSNLGANIRMGYRISREFSVEFEFSFYNSITLTGNGKSADIDAQNYSANFKWYVYPERVLSFDPYIIGKFGIMSVDVSGDLRVNNANNSSTFVGVGIGSDFWISKQWSLYIELNYYKPFGDLDNFDNFPIVFGVKMNF